MSSDYLGLDVFASRMIYKDFIAGKVINRYEIIEGELQSSPNFERWWMILISTGTYILCLVLIFKALGMTRSSLPGLIEAKSTTKLPPIFRSCSLSLREGLIPLVLPRYIA